MTTDATAPTGLGRRRPRLSTDETGRLMLDTAVAMVNRTGLTVSLDHISLEEVIREAGVSRSAAYRRWPYKDLFFSELLTELARAATPATVAQETTATLVRAIVLEGVDRLGTPEGRFELVVDLIRQSAEHDFAAMYASAEWRTYLALHATFASLADGRLRDDVQAALAAADRGFIERIARAWEHIATLVGFRMRPELGADFEALATLVSASSRGLILMALSAPGLATARHHAAPSGARPGEWSLTGLGIVSIATAFLEPDPAVVWDDARTAAVRELASSQDWPSF